MKTGRRKHRTPEIDKDSACGKKKMSGKMKTKIK